MNNLVMKVGTPVEQNMQTSLSKRTIGCIGKCTSGLSIDELDQITDNINKTLNHPRGREIFKKFLEQCDLRDNLECLALFEICFEIIEREQKFLQSKKEPLLESLIENVKQVQEMASDLDGVSQIDRALLERFNEALNSNSRNSLLSILEDIRNCCRDHLRSIHEKFKQYASEPCPMSR
ncbi:uncharacterized protein LOC100865963 isoform X3 [Apis florea]|uniref:uncharacterized protein LOC100865963 isoform X3 n=1 Tax=Apis florea TaxID=7463 RepID=UPI00062946A5|nr:uncharacterized protein LOC100865963 isoform X3 [Apis florea]